MELKTVQTTVLFRNEEYYIYLDFYSSHVSILSSTYNAPIIKLHFSNTLYKKNPF